MKVESRCVASNDTVGRNHTSHRIILCRNAVPVKTVVVGQKYLGVSLIWLTKSRQRI